MINQSQVPVVDLQNLVEAVAVALTFLTGVTFFLLLPTAHQATMNRQ